MGCERRTFGIAAAACLAVACGVAAGVEPSAVVRAEPSPGGEVAAQSLTRSRLRSSAPSRDLGDPDQKALYAVSYAHLDTQWRWDFERTIDLYIKATLEENFERFRAFPDYEFSFTGSARYEMMEEYYPELFETLRAYVDEGRWHVSGSSVDEGDVIVPTAEGVLRQVLYGNRYFLDTFGKVSTDFMLPDCFGFPAHLPSVWAHCGLLGFSTQKLTWESAVGIPFKVGVWEGPDGAGVIAALDPGSYARGSIKSGPADRDPVWAERITRNGEDYGLWADYHYVGVGDEGGAPRVSDIENYTANPGGEVDDLYTLDIVSSSALYEDITPELRASLPRFRGDMLLTKHSAGTLTSQAYVKRWTRQAERLADAAERAAVADRLLTGTPYPNAGLERGWSRVLQTHMHDILPGTSIPRAYRYSWNDLVLALNRFADVTTTAVGGVASRLDTRAEGAPLVVYNPLAFEREDIVTATVDLGGARYARVYGPEGEVAAQVVERSPGEATVIFPASVGPLSFTVFDVRPSDEPCPNAGKGPLRVTGDTLESERYRVTLDEAGDIASVYDKAAGRELLSAPAGLVFTHETPRDFPAWNMDWSDRQRPIEGRVDGAPAVRIVEDGPVRVALEVTRTARNSVFTQRISLATGGAGDHVEVDATIDWRGTKTALKADFPLAVANPMATYHWTLGTVDRGNNDPKKYEVPSHEWFGMVDAESGYGVTVLEDCKFGSDKPADNHLRLTLLYTPGVRNMYIDQHSQDWGLHEMRYGLAGHEGDWREADSIRRGRRFNQPLMAFTVDAHGGELGRSFSLGSLSVATADIRAIKGAEDRDEIVVRVHDTEGTGSEGVALRLFAPIVSARELDGQERPIGDATVTGGALTFDLGPYATRTFGVRLADAPRRDAPAEALPLAFDIDTTTTNDTRRSADPADAFDRDGRTYPGEMFPRRVESGGMRFTLGPGLGDGPQAAVCRGQVIELPSDGGGRVSLLASAREDAQAEFVVGERRDVAEVPLWTGFIGQWDDRVWDEDHPPRSYRSDGKVVALSPGYIKRAPVAWWATHRHHPKLGDEAYDFSYLFRVDLDVEPGERTIRLPYDERVRVMAASFDPRPGRAATPAAPLYDDLDGRGPRDLRFAYDDESPVYEGVEPLADIDVATHRSVRFDTLIMGGPRDDDDIDISRRPELTFVFHEGPNGTLRPHYRAGASEDGSLPRLNDGDYARNNDDTSRTVWFDNAARFTIDLGEAQRIASIGAFSWHRDNRSPQWFSVWGAGSDAMPDPLFTDPEGSGWTLIASVDTRPLGEANPHGSMIRDVSGSGTPPFRYLVFVVEDMGEGTFFTEIDIDFAEDGR